MKSRSRATFFVSDTETFPFSMPFKKSGLLNLNGRRTKCVLKMKYYHSLLNILLGIFCMLSCSFSYAQPRASYDELSQEARTLYRQKEYVASALKWDAAFRTKSSEILPSDRINAACVWSLVKERPKAFEQLNFLADSLKYAEYQYVIELNDFDNLKKDKEWPIVTEKIKRNMELAVSKWNFSLMKELNDIYKSHVAIRNELKDAETKYGFDSPQHKAIQSKKDSTDYSNMNVLLNSIEKNGWPGVNTVGKQAGSIALYMVQSSSLNIQEQLLPIIQESVRDGATPPSYAAHLEDRLLLKQGKKQLYGTQVGRHPRTGEYLVLPIENPENLDTRRKAMGLESMSTYLKYWDLTWSLANYEEMQEKIR